MVQFRSAAMIVNASRGKGRSFSSGHARRWMGWTFRSMPMPSENPDDLEATVERALAKKPTW